LKANSEYTRLLFVGFCALLLVYLLSFFIPPKVSQGINDLASWYTYYFSRKSTLPLKIVAIAVDENALNKLGQRWPWRRPVYARLLEILAAEKVNTVGIDFAFVGESADIEDDRILAEALKKAPFPVVLPYFFDFAEFAPVLPLEQLQVSASAIGLLNTPLDNDGKIRRLRQYVEIDKQNHYSFSVVLSAAFLKQKPEEIISQMPISAERDFLINFLVRPKDITTVSFSDVLDNLPQLKQRYGDGFLNSALVLVYPEAEILHDSYLTPLGKMSGGFLHLNGVVDILLGRFNWELNLLLLPFLIFSFLIIFYILRYCGFFAGALLSLGLLVFEFWVLVILSLNGIRFDYAYLANFNLAYFVLGSLYKYVSFLAQIIKIKDKATLDPLRNLFTLRYFYYRLGLEQKKIYFGKELYLVFISLDPFKEVSDSMLLGMVSGIWKSISVILCLKGKLWSVYSQEEIVGCLVANEQGCYRDAYFLKSKIDSLFTNNQVKATVKISYMKLKKNYPLRPLLLFLSGELKKRSEEIILFKPEDLSGILDSQFSQVLRSHEMLDNLDADIEEKNRQLLGLIENLNREHAKAKEAFFQIITSLVNALEARDAYTQGHSERVSQYSLMLADKLGWTAQEKEKLKKAGLLHDLGKIGIPDSVLHKKGPLTVEEYDIIKQHEVIGVKILQPLKELQDILPWILHHHERWDGKGYPHGLAADAIPEGAQIMALADVFDALSSGRDYKPAFSFEDSVKEILRNKGTQFSPRFTDIFLQAVTKTIIS